MKMTLREQIVQEALSWVGTPYCDHAALKGAGCDCAGFPCEVYRTCGFIPKDFVIPPYSPQQWLNSRSQTDKLKLKFEDRTFLNVVLKYSHHEVSEAEVQPGDLMMVLVAASWTHGGIIVDWPNMILHPVKGFGVIGSNATEGFWGKRPKRFFSMLEAT